jgi:hypothetical protein
MHACTARRTTGVATVSQVTTGQQGVHYGLLAFGRDVLDVHGLGAHRDVFFCALQCASG